MYQATWVTMGDATAGTSALLKLDGKEFPLGRIFPKTAVAIDVDVHDRKGKVLISKAAPLIGVEGRYPAACTMYQMKGRLSHGCLFDRDRDGRFDSFDAVMNVGRAFIGDVDAKEDDVPITPVSFSLIDGREIADLPLLSLYVSQRYERSFGGPGLFTCVSYASRYGRSCFGDAVSLDALSSAVEATVFESSVSLARAGERDVSVKITKSTGGAEIVVKTTRSQRHIIF
ncbi:hypothetical protein BWQ93_04510 [Sphingopyxis sp. QXT-31]|nr:hypothetical protein BWQ93_04510 [Sphingopyxis sp. QXT-31]